MIRGLFAALVAGVTAIAPVPAGAQTSLGIAGGVSAPVGRLGDLTDLGYNVAAGLNLGGTRLPVAIRLEGAFNGLGFKAGGNDVRIISGTANGIFNVSRTPDAPYLIAGVGVYNRTFSSSTFAGSGKTVVGINAGGGLRFPLSGLSTFFEARYHIMLGNTTENTNYQFIPITFGIMF